MDRALELCRNLFKRAIRARGIYDEISLVEFARHSRFRPGGLLCGGEAGHRRLDCGRLYGRSKCTPLRKFDIGTLCGSHQHSVRQKLWGNYAGGDGDMESDISDDRHSKPDR